MIRPFQSKPEYVYVPIPKSMRIAVCMERRFVEKDFCEFCVQVFIRLPEGWSSLKQWYSNN